MALRNRSPPVRLHPHLHPDRDHDWPPGLSIHQTSYTAARTRSRSKFARRLRRRGRHRRMPSLASVVTSHAARHQRRAHGRRSPAARLAPLALHRPAPRRARGRGRRPSDRAHDLLLRRLRRRRLEDDRRRRRTGRTSPTASSRPPRSARSPSRRPTRTSSTPAWARACIRGNVSHGDGVYRSTDGGQTWTQPRPGATRATSAGCAIHPHESRHRLRRGARPRLGPEPASAASSARSDGGATWEQVLFKSERAGAIDLTHGPAATRASSTPRSGRRSATRTSLTSGGPDSRPLASRPTAATPGPRSRATRACRKGVLGQDRRRRLAGARPAASGRWSRPRTARSSARTTAARPGSALSEERDLRRRALVLHAHLRRPAATPTPSGSLNYSTAGSRSTAARPSVEVPTPHGDNHDLWIDPREPAAHDRGQRRRRLRHVQRRRSRGRRIYNQPTAQFYHVIHRRPARRTASTARSRTTTAISLPSQSHRRRDHARATAIEPGGGESGYIAVKPGRSRHRLRRRRRQRPGHGPADRATTTAPGRSATSPSGRRCYGMGAGAERLKYRFQWTFPIVLSPHDPNALYVAGNRVFRSTDEGTSWEVDQPRPDAQRPDEARPVGRADHQGQHRRRGLLHDLRLRRVAARARRALGRLRRRPGPRLARRRPDLAERHAAGPARVGADQHHRAVAARRRRPPTSPPPATSSTTPRPYLFKTTDYGATWTRITDGIPDDEFTRVDPRGPEPARAALRRHRDGRLRLVRRRRQLAAARAATCRSCRSTTWSSRTRDLVVATHGRSFWILDDLTPLHQMADSVASAGAHLFAPRPSRALACVPGARPEARARDRDRVPPGRLARLRLSPGRAPTGEKTRRHSTPARIRRTA